MQLYLRAILALFALVTVSALIVGLTPVGSYLTSERMFGDKGLIAEFKRKYIIVTIIGTTLSIVTIIFLYLTR